MELTDIIIHVHVRIYIDACKYKLECYNFHKKYQSLLCMTLYIYIGRLICTNSHYHSKGGNKTLESTCWYKVIFKLKHTMYCTYIALSQKVIFKLKHTMYCTYIALSQIVIINLWDVYLQQTDGCVFIDGVLVSTYPHLYVISCCYWQLSIEPRGRVETAAVTGGTIQAIP